MNKMALGAVLAFACVFIIGIMLLGGQNAPANPLAQKFAAADAIVEKNILNIPPFDALQGKSHTSISQIVQIYRDLHVQVTENETREDFALLTLYGSNELMIFKTNSQLDADALLLALNSEMEEEGYDYEGRIQYEDICNVYGNGSSTIFALKKGNFVLLYK